jgi:phasin family protein
MSNSDNEINSLADARIAKIKSDKNADAMLAPKAIKPKIVKAKAVSKPKAAKATKTSKSPKASKAPKAMKSKSAPKAASRAKAKPAQVKMKSQDNTQKTTFNFMENIMTAKPYDFDKYTKDATAGSKDFYDAMQKSMNIWAKGVEKINQEAMSFAQDVAAKNQEAFKTLTECKDVNELTEIQTKLTQKHFDTLVTNATKLSEISVKVATDSFEPLNDQVNKAVKKASAAA